MVMISYIAYQRISASAHRRLGASAYQRLGARGRPAPARQIGAGPRAYQAPVDFVGARQAARACWRATVAQLCAKWPTARKRRGRARRRPGPGRRQSELSTYLLD